LVVAVDPEVVSGSTARRLWAEFDRWNGWGRPARRCWRAGIWATHQPGRQGTKTAAEGLARQAGSSTGAFQDAVNTSTRLPEQPKLARALRGGRLSSAPAALVSGAAAANPSEEAGLVELAARVSVAELREGCARVKAAADPGLDAINRRLHAQRQLDRRAGILEPARHGHSARRHRVQHCPATLYVRHGADPIPVTVRVQWTDGTEGEVNAWTSQWTRTHVCVYRETAPPCHPFWVRAADVRRR
jgi:hypothetical protein